MSLGLAQLMRKAAPILQAATVDEDSNLELIHRMATSKIVRPPMRLLRADSMFPQRDPNAPPIDPGMTPQAFYPAEQNPDAGFAPSAKTTQVPALAYQSPSGAPVAAPDPATESLTHPRRVMPELLGQLPDGPLPVPETPMVEELALRVSEALQTSESIDADEHSGLVYDRKGRPAKPQFLSTDAGLQTRAEYINALRQYEPENHNSRGRSSLIGAGRGALIGLATSGPGGAIGGALTGGLMHLFQPSLDERYAKDRDIAEAERGMASELKFRDAQSNLANEATERLYKRAQAERALNPQYKPDVITLANGDVVSVDGGVAKPILDSRGKQLKGKTNSTFEWRTNPVSGKGELWERRPGEVDKQVPGAVDASKDKVWSNFGWVAPGTALTAQATAENRDYSRGRQELIDNRRATERQEDLTRTDTQRAQARRQQAAGVVSRLAEARAKWIAADAKAQSETNAQAKAGWEWARLQAEAEAAAAATELSTGFSDLYESGIGDRGLAYFKEKAGSTPELSARPSKAGSIQPGEDPDVRAYANRYFSGNYRAAVEAIKRQKQ